DVYKRLVLDEYAPDRILIEPSGVGKLSDVIKAVMGIDSDKIVLNSYTTVADASKIRMYMKNFGEFYKNQVETAKTIVLSRTQKLSEEKLSEAVQMIRELNEHATIVTTNWDDIDGKQILAAMETENKFAEELLKDEDICPVCGHSHHHHDHDDHEEDEHEHHHHHHDDEDECCCHHHEHDEHEHHHHDHEDGECCHGHHHDHDHEHGECCHHDHEHGHHHHHADEVFTSMGIETAKKFTKEDLENALSKLSDEEFGVVLRAKGIVAGDGVWYHFDFVPEEYEVRTGSADVTGRMCVIGSKLAEDKIKTLFGV
ncbi:MAG: GTP-binding protein, partial [Oscillospiraceae bacterium]|nr:GTP-binding protein [Oscillospiraceae bacterium]